MTRYSGSSHCGDDQRNERNGERNPAPSDGSRSDRFGGLRFHRSFNDFHSSPLSSPHVVATGESDQHAGSRGATQYTCADTVVQFPSGRTFLPDSHASERELFIRDLVVICFVCITAAWVGCLVGAGLYIGKLVVAYLSGGA